MMRKIEKSLALIFISFVLAACGDSLKEAKKKGFSSIDEMKAMRERGYESMSDYQSAVEFTPSKFYRRCLVDDRNYSDDCKGHKVIWHGKIFDAGDARIDVMDSFKEGEKILFKVDVSSIRDRLTKSDVGRLIKFEGVVGRRNFVTPDVNYATILELETDKQLSERRYKEERMLQTKLELEKKIENQVGIRCKNQAKNEYFFRNMADIFDSTEGSSETTHENAMLVAAQAKKSLDECKRKVEHDIRSHLN